MEKAKTEKRTTHAGRACGKKDRARISIAMNDADRNISRLWQSVKAYNSRKHETAAETARRVFLRGLTAECEEIMMEKATEAQENADQMQGRFDF